MAFFFTVQEKKEKIENIFALCSVFSVWPLFFMLFVCCLYMKCAVLFFFSTLLSAGMLVSCVSVGVGGSAIPLVIAHRGGASLAPENTLLCIGRAIALGVDAVEVDVRLTLDGEVVLMHDARIDRTTTGSGRVASLTLAEIKSFFIVDAESIVTAERVPTLAELLTFVAGRCSVLIEVKDDDGRGVESAVLRVVESCNACEWVSVQSFSDGVLERFYSLGVAFPLEKLLFFKLPFIPYIFDGSFRRFSLEKYSYVSSFNINHRFAGEGLARRLQGAGKMVKIWVVDTRGKKSLRFVDGVITDFPQLWE